MRFSATRQSLLALPTRTRREREKQPTPFSLRVRQGFLALGAGRRFRRATPAVLALGLGDRTRQEDRDSVLGPDEDQGADRRGACARGRAGERETHFGGRGKSLAGDRVWRVLSSAQHDELLGLWLSGGVSGVGWMTIFRVQRPSERHHFFC